MAFDAAEFLKRELAKPAASRFAPSKRRVKQSSGRTARKQWNSQQMLVRAGGTTDLMKAIYAPKDPDTGELAKLCHVVKIETGLTPDGRPYRSPQEHQGQYYMGRGRTTGD